MGWGEHGRNRRIKISQCSQAREPAVRDLQEADGAENMKNVNCGTERNVVTQIYDLGAGEDQELKPAAARLRTGGQLGLHETNSKTKPEKMRGKKGSVGAQRPLVSKTCSWP